jgi:hypothetical protein
MIIAREKRKENIAEYILYMFQIEDIIRAYDLDLERIEKDIISQYLQPYQVKRDIREWYRSLIAIMKEHDLRETGHIPLIYSYIQELDHLNKILLKDAGEITFNNSYIKASSAIRELKARSGDPLLSDVEVSLNGLYGLLILKLQKKKINPETETAFGFISEWLAILSQKFHKIEAGNNGVQNL